MHSKHNQSERRKGNDLSSLNTSSGVSFRLMEELEGRDLFAGVPIPQIPPLAVYYDQVTQLPGLPTISVLKGSSSGTSLSVGYELGKFTDFNLKYNVSKPGTFSGVRIQFDNLDTSAKETGRLRKGQFLFGTYDFAARSARSEFAYARFVDSAGHVAAVRTGKFEAGGNVWKSVQSFAPAIDFNRLAYIDIFVSDKTVNSATKTGNLHLYLGGLNLAAPATPVITSKIPALNSGSVTVSGTKSALSYVILQGKTLTETWGKTTWSAKAAVQSREGIRVSAINAMGKESPPAYYATARNLSSPSVNTSFNSGESVIASRNVRLFISASDADAGDRVRVHWSFDGGTTWSPLVYYRPEFGSEGIPITLSDGDGAKNVLVQAKDSLGRVSSVTAKTILDTESPKGTMTVNGGSQIVTSDKVSVKFNVSDAGTGVKEVRVLDRNYWSLVSSYENYSTEITLPKFTDQYTIEGQVQDNTDRITKFSSTVLRSNADPTLTIVSQGRGGCIFKIDGNNVFSRGGGGGGGRGVNVAVLDPFRGTRLLDAQNFDTYGDSTALGRMITYLNNLPKGAIVMIGIGDEGGSIRTPEGQQALQKLGSTLSGGIQYWSSWAMICVVGESKPRGEVIGAPQTEVTTSAKFHLSLDTTPPTGTIKINNGAAATSTADVTLNLTANDSQSGPGEMRFSFDEGRTWSDFQPFNSVKAAKLPGDAGTKRVSYQVRDRAGLVSPIYSATIVLGADGGSEQDMTAPSVQSMRINGNAAVATSTAATVTVRVNEAGWYAEDMNSHPLQASWSFDNGVTFTDWSDFKPQHVSADDYTQDVVLTGADGVKKGVFRVRDPIGNIGTAYDDIILDTRGPDGSLVINNGSAFTYSRQVLVNVNVVDAGIGNAKMRVFDGAAWSAWGDFQPTANVTLGALHKNSIKVEVQDKLGNTSAFSKDVSFYDKNPTLNIESQGRNGCIFRIDGFEVFHGGYGGGGGRGINVGVLDPATGTSLLEMRNFDTYGDGTALARLTQFLDSLPNGSILIFGIGDESGSIRTDEGRALLKRYGSNLADEINIWSPWAMFAVKGQSEPLAEAVGSSQSVKQLTIKIAL